MLSTAWSRSRSVSLSERRSCSWRLPYQVLLLQSMLLSSLFIVTLIPAGGLPGFGVVITGCLLY